MKQTLARRFLVLAIAAAALALPASASAVNPDMTWTSPQSNQFFGNTLYITGTSANVDLGILDYEIDSLGRVFSEADPENPRVMSIAVDISQLSEGQHVVQGHAFPVGGAIDGSSGFSNFYKQFIVEHSIPDLTFSSPIADGASTATDHFTWTFSSIDAGAFRCSIDGAPVQACISPVTLNGLPDGAHSFSVYARDQAGNESAPQGVSYTINSAWATPPVTTFTSKPDPDVKLSQVTFGFESTTATSFECSVDSGTYAACTSPHTVFGLPDGMHTLSVRGTDPTGQSELVPISTAFTILNPGIAITMPGAVAPKVSKVSGKSKKIAVTVSGPGAISASVQACAKRKGATVCKKFTTGTGTATAAGRFTITLKKALKKKSKYRVTFTSTSSSGDTAKSVATIRTK